MAKGRPSDDGSRRSSRGSRRKVANAGGLEALGKQLGSGSGPGRVANEAGLRNLGARIDESRSGRGRGGRHSRRSGVRRNGKSRWSTQRKVVTVLTSLVVLAGLAVAGGYGYLRYRYDQISKVHVADEIAVQGGSPFTVLVIGSDSRVGESSAQFGSTQQVQGQRSDVVQLWRVTPSTKQLQIVSIPRDTVVSMVGADVEQFGTYNRINASFNLGADQLVKTITANLGIQINHVVEVDFAGFEGSVNALGGVYMNFNYPAKDSYSGLDVTTTGCQLLNGNQALAVARARHFEYYANGYWHYDPTSDFGRIQRQDAFIRALITAAKSKVNPLTVNAFIGSIHEGISIDDGFGLNQLIGLAETYHSFNPDGLVAQTLPTVSSTAFGGLGDVLAIDQPAAQQLLVNIFGSDLVTPTSPPPNADGVPEPPPTVTPTTVAPNTTTGTAPPAATQVPSYNPTPCTPA